MRNSSTHVFTLSEANDELQGVAHSHGWSLDAIELFELSAIKEQLKGTADTMFLHPSEIELHRTTQVLIEAVERVRPSRVVFEVLRQKAHAAQFRRRQG